MISIHHVTSADNPADIGTKALAGPVLEAHISNLMVMPNGSKTSASELIVEDIDVADDTATNTASSDGNGEC